MRLHMQLGLRLLRWEALVVWIVLMRGRCVRQVLGGVPPRRRGPICSERIRWGVMRVVGPCIRLIGNLVTVINII